MKLKVPISYFLTDKRKLIIDPSSDDPATFLPTSYVAAWDSDRAVVSGGDKRWEGVSDQGNKTVVKWHAERWELYSVKGEKVTLVGYRKSARPLGQYHSDAFEKVVVK